MGIVRRKGNTYTITKCDGLWQSIGYDFEDVDFCVSTLGPLLLLHRLVVGLEPQGGRSHPEFAARHGTARLRTDGELQQSVSVERRTWKIDDYDD